MRTISQSKSLHTSRIYEIRYKDTGQILEQCLEADIRARTKTLKNDNFTPLFSDAHSYLKNGQYEQYLLTLDKKAPTLGKPKQNTPF